MLWPSPPQRENEFIKRVGEECEANIERYTLCSIHKQEKQSPRGSGQRRERQMNNEYDRRHRRQTMTNLTRGPLHITSLILCALILHTRVTFLSTLKCEGDNTKHSMCFHKLNLNLTFAVRFTRLPLERNTCL